MKMVKMEQLLNMRYHKMRQNRISINDIKWDLIKIIEPHDGLLESQEHGGKIVYKLFNAYLRDLMHERKIQDYSIVSTMRDTAFTYDIAVKVSADRSPKKLKIHVGTYQSPWVSKKAAA